MALLLPSLLSALALAPPPRAAVRMGAPPGIAGMPTRPLELADDAVALLEEAGGDAEKARMSFMGYTLAYLEDAEPEIYASLKAGGTLDARAHAALTEITWDAIGAFLPATHDPTPTPAAQRKLTAVARAACDGALAAPRVLDVGCGSGLLLPFLAACGLPPDAYRGIDLSGRMIECARAAHGAPMYAGAVFEDVAFDDAGEAADGPYDSIVFNGSLQFFRSARQTLAAAAALLAPGPSSVVVVAHLNGGAFVRKEQAETPATVLSLMPSLAELQAAAAELGMVAVLPSFLGDDAEAIGAALEDEFYLAVLRWDAEHGGAEAE